MTNQETFAAAAKWAQVQSIVGTHGLSLELSRLARRLLEEEHAEALEIVEAIRDNAGEIDELKRKEADLMQRLQGVEQAICEAYDYASYMEDCLRNLGLEDEAGESVVEEEEADKGPFGVRLPPGRRY